VCFHELPLAPAGAVAELVLVRSMRRALTPTLIFLLVTHSLSAQQEPPEDVFDRSSRDLIFHVPSDFQLVRQDRKYLNPTAHEVPNFQRIWQRGTEGIIVQIVVLPEAAWQQGTPTQRFDLGLGAMLSDPTLKLVSRRNYEFEGCPAVSITCFYEGAGGTSQRMDCFLAKPNMFMVAYLSSKPSSWDDPASKAFFQTVSLKPKK
jgi:hypothetical protein